MNNTLFAGLIVAMMVVVLLLLAIYLRAQGNRRKDQKARGELNEELRKALRSRGAERAASGAWIPLGMEPLE